MLRKLGPRETGHVFRRSDDVPLSADRLDQQHARIRNLLKLPADFVLHFGTHLGLWRSPRTNRSY